MNYGRETKIIVHDRPDEYQTHFGLVPLRGSPAHTQGVGGLAHRHDTPSHGVRYLGHHVLVDMITLECEIRLDLHDDARVSCYRKACYPSNERRSKVIAVMMRLGDAGIESEYLSIYVCGGIVYKDAYINMAIVCVYMCNMCPYDDEQQ